MSEHQLLPITSPLPIVVVCRTGDPIVFRTGADRAGAYPLDLISLEDGIIGAGTAIPLIVDGRTLGAFGLSFLETRELSTEDVSFTLTLAHLAAQALQRSRLFEAEEAARAQAEVAVRDRDEFLAVAAHELKSPITSLLGFTQVELHWYQREVDRYPEQTGRSLEIIDLQARRLSQMIARLFDVAQIDSKKLILQPQATVLTELVGDVVRSFQNGLIQHAIVVDAVPTAMASIDQLRFEQVLTNLIDNAVKYSPEGSTIEIQVTQPCFDLVQIAVRDHGPGIVPERRGHIFERYYQADHENHRSGLGLGLYICHQIVDLHGGQIWAEFPDDGGTRIVITVPATES